MSNIIEDGINFGMGLFAYSREKIEEMVEKMVEKGEVQRKDAQSFASDLVKKGEVQRKELKQMITSEVHDTLQDVGLTADQRITKDDLRAIIREEIAAAKKDEK
ncbi:phasin family protein [Christensenella timonensis]|uniref:phasin family protein n=1 Tax=Christensenella timonensis TaxID=1816678 RepID=UPI00082AF91C|nr:hypothetical protein [Christensenella timonensis]